MMITRLQAKKKPADAFLHISVACYEAGFFRNGGITEGFSGKRTRVAVC